MASILDPNDPGLYRNQRGRVGADPVMMANSGPRGRVLITSGEGQLSHDAADALEGWRNVFRPNSLSFAVLVLGLVLFLINARAHVAVQGMVGAR
jgi:hypothetical protein